MKKFIVAFLFLGSVVGSYAQHTDFRKTVENRYSSVDLVDDGGEVKEVGRDNVASKSGWESLLFGATNADVEFSVEPSFEGAYGLRLRRSAPEGSLVLEAVRISNCAEVEADLERKFPTVAVPARWMTPEFPEDILDIIARHNRAMRLEREKERAEADAYDVSAVSVPVGERFAGKLRARFVSFIDRFEGGRLPAGELRSDGESTTFRTVAGDELRTLRIGFKTENEARALSDLCKRMIADIEAGRFDEREYGSMDR